MVLAIQPASVHAHVLIGTTTTPAVGRYSSSKRRFVPRHVLRPEVLGRRFPGVPASRSLHASSNCRISSVLRLAAAYRRSSRRYRLIADRPPREGKNMEKVKRYPYERVA